METDALFIQGEFIHISMRKIKFSRMLSNASVEIFDYLARRRKNLPNFHFILPKFHFILPKFHFILPKFYFAPPWRIFIFS